MSGTRKSAWPRAVDDIHERAGASRPQRSEGICGSGRQSGYYEVNAALGVAQAEQDTSDGPHFQQLDIETNDIGALPDAGYAVLTCRLVFAFIKDKAAFLDRIRYLLPPGGTLWVVTPLAERLPDERKSIGINLQHAELLTWSWSSVRSEDLGTLRCYALRP